MSRFRQQHRAVSLVATLAMVTAFTNATAMAATDGSTSKHTSTQTRHAATTTDLLSQDQALKQARSTGKPVAISSAETSTSSLTANPSGSLTLTSYAQPMRKKVDGTWHSLNAALTKNPDGTISPSLSTDPLALSDGGKGPLVTMHSGTHSMALSLPVALPAPVLSGDTATYPNVVPGIDLAITVDDQGGFRTVYIVHNAAAAENPELGSLLTTDVTAPGLHLSTDAAGTIHAADNLGRDVFSAPTPTMWDSSTTAVIPHTPKPAASSASRQAAGSASSALAPGTRAHAGPLGEHLSGTILTLSADAALLNSRTLQYPVYMDPPWSAYSNGDWATVSENYPTEPKWRSSAESEGLMQVGMSPTGFWADTLINFNIPTGEIYGGGTPKIESAYFYATNFSTDNPNTSIADLYAPSATLTSSNDTWDDWFTSSRDLGSAIGTANFAQNVSASVPFSISTGWLSESKSTQTFALAGDSYSDEESNTALYKVLDNPDASSGTAAPSISLTFTHAPTVSALSTSPNKPIIGDGAIALHARVADVDGGTLSVAFDAYINGNTSDVIKSATLSAGVNTFATLWIYQPALDTDVTKYGGSSATSMSVDWQVTVTNGNSQSATSSIENFTYSTAIPGAPNVYDAQDDLCNDANAGDTVTYTVGQPATFYLTPEGSTTPSTYVYQLNAAQPVTVNANGTKQTEISVVPESETTILSVYAVAASGNIGQSATCVLNAAAPANASAGNLSGGPNPDLVIPGSGTTSLPAGLWDASSDTDGEVNADASNIGIYGNGVSSTDTSATTFNKTEVVVGMFTGSGYNAVLDYNPNTLSSNGSCSAQLQLNPGPGLPLDPNASADVTSPVFTGKDPTTSDAYCATSVANGGNLDAAENQGTTSPADTFTPQAGGYVPDLLMVADGALVLEPADQESAAGLYPGIGSAVSLSTTNPTGSGSWTGWSIYALYNAATDLPAMFAVNNSTGAVYYYSIDAMAQLAYNVINGTSGTVTTIEVATSGFTTSSYADLEPTTVNGSPGLWAVTVPTGSTPATVDTYELTGSTLTKQTGISGLSLGTPSHAWAMNDATTGDDPTAADADSTTTLTGSSGAAWTTADFFSPDITLNGTNGNLTSSSSILNLKDSFTVSVWAEPQTLGSMALSQNGTEYPGLMLYPTSTGWEFYLATNAGTAWGGDDVIGGTVQLGAWAHLVATYDASTKAMSLYVDNTFVATGTHTAPSSTAAGALELGSNIDNGSQTGFFTGDLAQLQTWSGTATPPVQPSTNPAYHQAITPERILDTRADATNAYSGIAEADTPLGADSTKTVPIWGDTVTALNSGPSTIPDSATAVAVDVTLTEESANGDLVVYPDGSQRPLTSATNYATGTNITGYQVVPIGPDGKIALYNSSTGTTHMLVDITGYFTTDSTLTGDQTYHPLTEADRIFDSRSNIKYTSLTSTGAVAANTSFTVTVTGDGEVPSTASAVAINLTATEESGSGLIEAYQTTGNTAPTDTSLTYTSGSISSLSADVSLGTGSYAGQITIYNNNSTADIIGDISGYYTTNDTGQVYHTVNPTRLVDTRSGIGGQTGAIAIDGTYPLTDADQITNDPTATLALMLTSTDSTEGGDFIAYPDGGTRPGTSNLNWGTDQNIANLALVPLGSDGDIDIYNSSGGTTDLVVDCSGYFANS